MNPKTEAQPAHKPDRFVCTMCGNCCRGQGHVYLSRDDIMRIARALDLTVPIFLERYCERHEGRIVLQNQANEDCTFLDGNRCRVHDVKPEQCHKWPFWTSVVNQPRQFAHAKSYCEGLKDFEFEDFARVARSEQLFPNV